MDIKKLFEHIITRADAKKILVVGIDGLGGAGKSTLSGNLETMLLQAGLQTIVLHIDDFIHPKIVRYRDDIPAWECYYHLQWRYDYFLYDILAPMRKKHDFHGIIEIYDKEQDSYTLQTLDAEPGTIVLVEGIFLQRKELQGYFDTIIYLDVPEKIRLQRVLHRDSYIGDTSQIAAKYESRYFPAERYYVKTCAPAQYADLVVTEEKFFS